MVLDGRFSILDVSSTSLIFIEATYFKPITSTVTVVFCEWTLCLKWRFLEIKKKLNDTAYASKASKFTWKVVCLNIINTKFKRNKYCLSFVGSISALINHSGIFTHHYLIRHLSFLYQKLQRVSNRS